MTDKVRDTLFVGIFGGFLIFLGYISSNLIFTLTFYVIGVIIGFLFRENL